MLAASGALGVLTAVGGVYAVARIVPADEPARARTAGTPTGYAEAPIGGSGRPAAPADRDLRQSRTPAPSTPVAEGSATPGRGLGGTPDPLPERSPTEADRRALRKLTDPGDHAAEHVEDVRADGRYLRVYTDLAEEDANTGTATELCERAMNYLAERGIASPVVFVQAEYGENGNPVLANILGPDDSTCLVTHPDPRD